MNSLIRGWSLQASDCTCPSKCSRISWSVGSNFTPAGSPGKSCIPAYCYFYDFVFLVQIKEHKTHKYLITLKKKNNDIRITNTFYKIENLFILAFDLMTTWRTRSNQIVFVFCGYDCLVATVIALSHFLIVFLICPYIPKYSFLSWFLSTLLLQYKQNPKNRERKG